MIRKAIIPAAGYGIRNLPVTKAVPKEMFPIAGRPTIAYIVEEAIQAGIEEILIILSRNKSGIMNYFDRSIELEWFLTSRKKEHLIPSIKPPAAEIHYIRQHEALGLGHAVQLAESFASGEPCAVLLPDQVSLEATSMLTPLIKAYEQHTANVVGLQRVKPELLQNYGVVSASPIDDRLHGIHAIVEKPKHNPPSDLAVMGRYILMPEVYPLLRNTKPGHGEEIQLTDALNSLCADSKMIGYEYRERWYDTSIEEDYLRIQLKAYQINKRK
ncbi:UTP--glucose-1-phosphate uridylyltransferase [Paenibacillus sp. J5C_2022]|uniref:UTP--glucose-1-phosphate uridylyltransferase n=1 Tax=Paenibacillus sp. J5C2022 TaxID=2977129 RepID=UPI0021D017B2|nr:UTP--glucose-1-phosphate uridylyltransferase [Paenibacillus sp. J5C2022]MCU6707492.1 UTP--glucose-1-phosphate uridylyltransferase [Paenibacillus sp. J5C2022]